ncbi:MAG TPA: metallophosphoesterase, partial [Pseudonocardiaceae bacterium]
MRRRGIFPVVLVTVLVLLFGLSWWTLVLAPAWPTAVFVAGTVVFAVGMVGFPVLMVTGHGRRHRDAAARIGDTTLGVIWVCFTWSVLGQFARLVLAL